jgi:glycosyltransferase involved in cell wall biosynthesis
MRLILATSSYPAYAEEAVNAGVFVRAVAAQLVQQGHAVHILTPAKGQPITGSPAPVHTFEWGGSERVLTRLNPRRPLDLLRLGRLMWKGRSELRRLIDEVHADAVVAMWAIPAGFWAQGVQRPYVVWVLGSDIWGAGRYPLGRTIVRNVLQQADHVFGNSLYLLDGVQQIAGREAEFLAAGRTLPVAETPAASLPERHPQYVFIGRWDRAKGIDVLLDAMELVIQRLPDAHLHLFGGGPLEAEIRSRAGQGRLRDCITVYGFAEPATAVAYLKAADALVISSRIESMPVLYSDALQCGCPVVATNVGDLGRLTQQQATGLVCPPEDAGALADAMCQVQPLWRWQYADALQQAATMFDPARSAARCAEVLASSVH